MFRVRHYDQTIHPDHFQKGVLGRWIRVLNWCRWKLEVYIQRLTIKYLSREGALPKERVKSLMRTFDVDVRAEQVERLQTSPSLGGVEIPLIARADAYRKGAGRSVLDQAKVEADKDILPIRPQSIDALAARYAHESRSKRYARGKRFSVGDEDGDFEPVSRQVPKTLVVGGSNDG